MCIIEQLALEWLRIQNALEVKNIQTRKMQSHMHVSK